MKLREVKDLLSSHNPLTLGRYPGRPAPAHVLNGFLAASLGTSSRGSDLRALLASNGPPPTTFEFLAESEWAQDPLKLGALRSDLSLVFNPDRRLWEQHGSPVPVMPAMATVDPSDDGLGPLVWELVSQNAKPDPSKSLSAFYSSVDHLDPVRACAAILVGDAEVGDRRSISVQPTAWFSNKGSACGSVLAQRLASFATALVQSEDPKRLLQIQHLARGIYLVSFLALLLGPVASVRKQSVDSVHEILPLLAWAGTPPGSGAHPMVLASARSFQSATQSHKTALVDSLTESVARHRLPTRLPARQRGRASLRAQLLSGGLDEGRADASLDRLAAQAGVSLEMTKPPGRKWVADLINRAYPDTHVTSGFRSMGRKIGFTGPDRGTGSPRFVCETPLLGTLVDGLCPFGSSMDFVNFVDLARSQLGIVFGPGSDTGLVKQVGFWEGVAVGRRLLEDNQEALRRRLVRAGLAYEYSDGHTEVVNSA